MKKTHPWREKFKSKKLKLISEAEKGNFLRLYLVQKALCSRIILRCFVAVEQHQRTAQTRSAPGHQVPLQPDHSRVQVGGRLHVSRYRQTRQTQILQQISGQSQVPNNEPEPSFKKAACWYSKNILLKCFTSQAPEGKDMFSATQRLHSQCSLKAQFTQDAETNKCALKNSLANSLVVLASRVNGAPA